MALIHKLTIALFFLLQCITVSARDSLVIQKSIPELKSDIAKGNINQTTLRQISRLLLTQSDFEGTLYYTGILDSISLKEKNDTGRVYAAVYAGQAMMRIGNAEEANRLMQKSLTLATKINDNYVLATVYNALGLYASNIEMDHYKAMEFFFEGLEKAKMSSNDRVYALLLCNISCVYYIKKDASGLKYAEECYQFGHRVKDDYLIYCGSITAAYFYYLSNEAEKALKLIKEAEMLSNQNDFHDKADLYNLYGKILELSDDDIRAIEYYKKSISTASISSKSSSIAESYLNLGMVYLNRKEPSKAISSLLEGINYSQELSNKIYILHLNENLSKAYELKNDYNEALTTYKQYHILYDSIFNKEKEKSLNELQIKYEVEKRESELQQSKLIILQEEKKTYIVSFTLILTVIILLLLYISYRKKHKLYLQIVRKNQENVKRERDLKLQIESLTQKKEEVEIDTAEDKYMTSSLSQERELELYKSIINLFEKDEVYRQEDLTKEKLSHILNTNRTYLSQVINKYTSQSYNHFVNSYRIEEAIRILSDPEDETPLKAIASDIGFKSPSTFYHAFQSAVGMTPATYRDKIKILHKQEYKYDTDESI